MKGGEEGDLVTFFHLPALGKLLCGGGGKTWTSPPPNLFFLFFIPLGPLTNTLLSCSSGEATTGRCCYFTGRKHCWALESPKVFMPSSLFLLKWTGEGASVVSFLRRRSICRKPLYLLCESAPHPPLMVIPTKTFPPFSSSCGWDGYGSVGRSVGRLLAG